MFHSFNYPDETGQGRLGTNFWRPRLSNGVLTFPRPDDDNGKVLRKDIRAMVPKRFGVGVNMLPVDLESQQVQEAGA